MGYQQVTYIDDLPELDELGSVPPNNGFDMSIEETIGPTPFQRATQNSIHQSPHADSGMTSQIQNKFIRPAQTPMPYESGMTAQIQAPYMMPQPQQQPPQIQMPSPPAMSSHTHSDHISCLDVANHVENCPVCSKLFKTDQTIMIIALVVLSVLCLLLLKRVLNL